MARVLLAVHAVLLAIVTLAPPVHAAPPTPESFLGHPVGADGKLADWSQITDYFDALDGASDRIEVKRLGKTTLDRDFLMAVISSPANLANAERYREIARRLAGGRGLRNDEAEALVREGRAIVLVTCNIHSTEIGSSQMAMEWAHQLATSEDRQVARWLDEVILLLVPSLNPDGTDMVVDWYRKHAGGEWDGGRLPWLYHHYAGHDNNRDWYMLNLVETRMVNRVLHHEWFPQVFLDEHQMGSAGPRIFVPPYSDPHSRAVHPMEVRFVDLIGTNMALRLEQAEKRGVISSYAYDAYWPGGTKNTAAMKNVVGLLTEVASCRIASPVFVDPSELRGARKGLPDYQPQVNFPNPWPGGWWRLRDIVDYEWIISNSLLETCADHREDLLRGMYRMAREATSGTRPDGPRAYVVPVRQHDPASAAAMVEVLRENGLDAKTLPRDFVNAEGQAFEKGSVVFETAQPYRPFLIEMMERQRYPEIREGLRAEDIIRPYDVTAWTLPLLMGVEWATVAHDLDVALAPYVDSWAPGPVREAAGAEGHGYLIDPASNDAYRLVNALLATGVGVERILEPFEVADVPHGAGQFFVAADGRAALLELAPGYRAAVRPLPWDLGQDLRRTDLKAPRIGLYQPWLASMDEGWTRLVLDRSAFRYVTLHNDDVKKGKLESRHDVIVLPSASRRWIEEGRRGRPDGYEEGMPPPYDGGIGKEGVKALEAFVKAGGSLVCLGESAEVPIEHFNIPVRDAVADLRSDRFSVPGTLLNLEVDTTHPLGFGMPDRVAAYVTGGPVFATTIPGAGVGRSVVARYPVDERDILASGWASGLEHLEGRAAIVEVGLGKGRVILLGPRVQHRGQTHATYKLLFNALYRGAR